MCRINRWFGGVATTRKLIERVASRHRRQKRFPCWKLPPDLAKCRRLQAANCEHKGISLDVTDLDRVPTHLVRGNRAVVADALALPFHDNSFDLVSCSLFAHHLEPAELAHFTGEALRVSRCAVLINDLVRHPMHLALVYAGFAVMRSYVSRVDGLASVRRAYVPHEMRQILSSARQTAGEDRNLAPLPVSHGSDCVEEKPLLIADG